MKNKQIEALEKLIALKDETIKELERQVQLLKNQPPVVVPQFPEIPHTPVEEELLAISSGRKQCRIRVARFIIPARPLARWQGGTLAWTDANVFPIDLP